MTLRARAALLVVLLGLVACPPAVRAASTPAGVHVEPKCSKAARDSIDTLNRQPVRAKIQSATCRADGTLEKVRLRALEGGDLEWTSDEGLEALARRMKQGR